MPDERRDYLRPVQVTKLCGVCGADLVGDNQTLMSSPPQVRHRCPTDASHPVQTFRRRYPTIEYEAITAGAVMD